MAKNGQRTQHNHIWGSKGLLEITRGSKGCKWAARGCKRQSGGSKSQPGAARAASGQQGAVRDTLGQQGLQETSRSRKPEQYSGDGRAAADKYLLRLKADSSFVQGEGSRFSNDNDNGFISDVNSFGYHPLTEESPSLSSASEPPRVLDPTLDGSKRSMGSISTLKDLCMMEGLDVTFQPQPPSSANPLQKNEVHAQVVVDGQVLGKGIGLTWDEAKMRAAEKALGSLKPMLGQFSQKRQGSPRALQGMSNKRLKPEYARVLHQMPSSARYPRNASSIP
ncbi:C-terminal domain phosphatase-like 1 [Actinidia rufa]|uniref:C-terminal domain phosphatase-like 1 n=1 Tax=Actinidia rufa TaxID=165716 RepID=A0A7J0EZI4_9ERIC|nr:C-terminal domain phosphatase-like 1 [Actinidia rufa]